MALFTDGTMAAVEDLTAYEAGIQGVATGEGLDLSKKLSLAQEEIGIEIAAFLTQLEEDGDLGKVIVTDPLRKWHVFQSLALAYRDAHHSQLNDRYLGKWRECERLAKWAMRLLFDTGVGVTATPIPKAGAPLLSAVAGAGAAATYYARVCWTDANGEEGAPSAAATLSVAAGNLLVARVAQPPACARGWNLFAGVSATALSPQNDAPLGLGSSWTLPASGLRSGRAPGDGQKPQRWVTAKHALQRG